MSDTNSSSTEQAVRVTLRNFEPDVEPSKLDFTTVRFFAKNPQEVELRKRKQQPTASTAKPTTTELPKETSTFSQTAIKEIGRWSEGCTYYALGQHYRAKYPAYQFVEDATGFTLFDKHNRKNSVQVIWYNKDEEQFKSKDITIIKAQDGEVTKHHIEVKGTTSNTEHAAEITHNEFLKMLKYSKDDTKRYSIFRVYNAGKAERVRIEKIKNPLEKILNKELEVNSLNLKI